MGRVYTPRVSIAPGLAVLLFVLTLIALSIGQRRVVAGPSVALLRSLFPSWRFFETPEEQVLLLARCVAEGESGPFLPAIPAAPRGLSTLLFSARGNLLLACHDLVDSLVCELSERGTIQLSQAEQLTSYRLVQNMVCWHLRQHSPGLSAYQLKLVSRAADGSDEELFVSPVYPC